MNSKDPMSLGDKFCSCSERELGHTPKVVKKVVDWWKKVVYPSKKLATDGEDADKLIAAGIPLDWGLAWLQACFVSK